MSRFKEKFGKHVCAGDSIDVTVGGTTYTATIQQDTDYGIDHDDCHSTDQSVTGCTDRQHNKLLKHRQAWFNGEWFYCGIVISANRGVLEADHVISLWGIECNYPTGGNKYLNTVANELLNEAIQECTK